MHQRTHRTDPEVDPPPEVPTAKNKTPFKTILNSMTDSPMISMGDTPLKVMILSRRHFTVFPGQSQWLASAMRQMQMAKQIPSQS